MSELGTIERSIDIDAGIETVFEVISSPAHLTNWWPDEALFEPEPNAVGTLVFNEEGDNDPSTPKITIITVDPPKLFVFRWLHPADEAASETNSLLVTFELENMGSRTRLKMTETGFREQGWEVAVLEEQLRLHEEGWDYHLARLVAYAPLVRTDDVR